MSIINDVEIRKRCLIPTHFYQGNLFKHHPHLLDNVTLYSKTENGYYDFRKGTKVSDEEIAHIEPHLQEYNKCFDERRMITPFNEKLTDVGKISYGLSSFGYDATCGNKFKIAVVGSSEIIDPKNLDVSLFQDFEGDECIIPPHGFALTYTKETFDIPEDILAICMAKSTYARCGLVVGVTPLEPGWAGQVTIELSNTTSLPIKVYANEGICQFLFLQGNDKAETPYNQRGGKYMNQEGIVLPKILR